MSKKERLYWRSGRAWADFRDYADVGGKREPLISKGMALATKDPDLAFKLIADRLADLEKRRRSKELHGVSLDTTLAEYVERHLIKKAEEDRVEYNWLERTEKKLLEAISYFGEGRLLHEITPTQLKDYVAYIGRKKNRSGETLSEGTQRHYLNALSGLFGRALSEGYVTTNPVASMYWKPTNETAEADWLEIPEAAKILTAALNHSANRYTDIQCLGQIVATFLLVGGRRAEILGLETGDLDFDRKTVTIRSNRWRRLKTAGSARVVPMWPQLEEILKPYVDAHSTNPLLFPSEKTGEMIVDLRKSLDPLATEVKLGRELHTKMFRHTYCAARLQTLDNGKPVSIYTVSGELGHKSTTMVEKVYSHLGKVRHRSEVVEYRNG